MDMKTRILTYLQEFVAVPSVSDSPDEKLAVDWLFRSIGAQEYFQAHPDSFGRYPLPGDYRAREIVYGMVEAERKTDRTVILTGHYDVVGIEEYGALKPLAFDMAGMTEAIAKEKTDEQTRADALSGEWLFGRGCADMKGGLCAGLAVLDELGREGCSVNVLFMAVPDEESYSAGMRGAAGFLTKLQKQYGLTYEVLLCLEPGTRDLTGTRQSVYIGSVGKCMPTVLVQGKKAHVGTCFQGLNAVSVLARFFEKTELSPEFADVYENEVCVPPTWLYLKDQKQAYDVSLPLRACGYLNMLSFDTTPQTIMEQLKLLGQQAFCEVIGGMRESAEQIAAKSGQPSLAQSLCADIPRPQDCLVLEFSELVKRCEQKDGFAAYYERQYRELSEKIQTGEWNYPQATIELAGRVLDFADLTEPVMLFCFSPPFYPAFHSDRLSGKENAGTEYYERLKEAAGHELERLHYFTGISDLSYCGSCGDGAPDAYYRNTPLWGDLYQVDFAAIEGLNIPSILYGPWGKNIHQRTERVNIKSLTQELPQTLLSFIGRLILCSPRGKTAEAVSISHGKQGGS